MGLGKGRGVQGPACLAPEDTCSLPSPVSQVSKDMEGHKGDQMAQKAQGEWLQGVFGRKRKGTGGPVETVLQTTCELQSEQAALSPRLGAKGACVGNGWP